MVTEGYVIDEIFPGLSKLNRLVQNECPIFPSGAWLSWVVVALDFYPYYLTFGMWAISFYKNELYLGFLSLALTFDIGINMFLKNVVFKMHPTFPGCGDIYEMPSFSVEQGMIFTGLLYGLIVLWSYDAPAHKIVQLHLVAIIPVYTKMYIGINTPEEIVAAVLVGCFSYQLWLILIHLFLWPYFKTMIKWKVNIFKYEDNLCGEFPDSGRLFRLKKIYRKKGLVGFITNDKNAGDDDGSGSDGDEDEDVDTNTSNNDIDDKNKNNNNNNNNKNKRYMFDIVERNINYKMYKTKEIYTYLV
jgi:hypothetical protein